MKISISKNALTRGFDYAAYYERRTLLYRKLGGVCSDCGVEQKQIYVKGKKKKSNLEIHHVFYPFGEFEPSHNWGICIEDDFWNIHFPEIMESCVLLCTKCHRKVTRYNFVNQVRMRNA